MPDDDLCMDAILIDICLSLHYRMPPASRPPTFFGFYPIFGFLDSNISYRDL
jgi:hypothetical protein